MIKKIQPYVLPSHSVCTISVVLLRVRLTSAGKCLFCPMPLYRCVALLQKDTATPFVSFGQPSNVHLAAIQLKYQGEFTSVRLCVFYMPYDGKKPNKLPLIIRFILLRNCRPAVLRMFIMSFKKNKNIQIRCHI